MNRSLVPNPESSLGAKAKALTGNSQEIGKLYTTNPNNWYKALPYSFMFTDRNGNSTTVHLPILPSNISTITHFATNVVTSLYGIIEEHSEVRFYDITISGTTGITPRFIADIDSVSTISATGRESFKYSAAIDLGGFLPEITNTINQVRNMADNIGQAVKGTDNNSGVTPAETGYTAFHNLFKSFLKYKNDAAGVTSQIPIKQHPIQFMNYKDSIKYDCAPLNFTLTRSAENPMLYNYNIKLRCYNLRGIDSNDGLEQDQLKKLGLNGLKGQSIFSSLTSIAGNAATLISGLL